LEEYARFVRSDESADYRAHVNSRYVLASSGQDTPCVISGVRSASRTPASEEDLRLFAAMSGYRSHAPSRPPSRPGYTGTGKTPDLPRMSLARFSYSSNHGVRVQVHGSSLQLHFL